MKKHMPDFKFTSMVINYNTTAYPHKDKGNRDDKVVAAGFGEYEGGNLQIYDDEFGIKILSEISIRHRLVSFSASGKAVGEYHGNAPFEGTRFFDRVV